MTNRFSKRRSLWAFLWVVIKLFIAVYRCYAIFLRPIHPPPTENQGCKPYELLPYNSCKLNYYHHIRHIIVVYGTFMDILQSKINHRNSDFSFIKKAGNRPRTILFEICTAETLVMSNISIRYIKQIWNDFAYKTAK